MEYQVFGVLSHLPLSAVRRIMPTPHTLQNFITPYRISQPFFWHSLVL